MEPVAHPDHEVRFGLVLYGGVSLAIYIYGVAYEFQRLVRASQGVETNAWTEVLKAANVSATVDIVSGASAGGINGLLLAKALTSGADLRAVRSLWIDEADLGRLLHDAGEDGPRSLLRSDRFAELLRSGLETMDQMSLKRRLVSAFDLFIAATRIRPWVRDFPTDLDGTIRTNVYRKSFELKLRRRGYNPAEPRAGYERDDFAHGQNQVLAEVAQATSAFPVAFEPVAIEVRDANRHLFASDEPSGYFSDGGILHNKPFTETISTILTRAAGDPVRRWLVSVEPDPEHTIPPAVDAAEPEVTEVASKAVFGIPRYQSVAADLTQLEEHRERAARARRKLAGIDTALLSTLRSLSEGERQRWRRDVLEASDYRNERGRRLAEFVVDRGLVGGQRAGRSHGAQLVVAQELILSGDYGDPDFERRRVQHLLEMLRPLLPEQSPEGELRQVLSRAQLELWAQFDRVEDAIWQVFERHGPIEPAADLRVDVERLQTMLGELSEHLAEVRARTREICERLDAHSRGPSRRGEGRDRFTLVFDWFELWDAQLLTIDELSESGSRDRIMLARISPADAHFIQKPPANKLAGDALGHFGGFLKREWRANDVLWGRLDAAETISRILMRDRAGGGEALEAQIRRAQSAVVADELPDVKGDYRSYMENQHTVGSESLEDVAMEDRANLLLQASDVLRNMARGISAGGGSGVPKNAFGGFAKLLGFLLFFLRWPVRAIWGSDPAWRRIASLGILFVGLWAITAIVLLILGIVDVGTTLLTLIAAALGVVLIWSTLRAIFR